MESLCVVSANELKKIRESEKNLCNPYLFCKIAAAAVRTNMFWLARQSGEAVPRSCFGKVDIATWLWTQVLKNPSGFDDANDALSDTFFGSPCDAPLLYSLLLLMGYENNIEQIREDPRVEGLLRYGIGLSRACGRAIANQVNKKVGRIYVVLSSEEMQEKYMQESLRHVAEEKFSEIMVIINYHTAHQDMSPREASDLAELPYRLHGEGWEVAECDGHNFRAIDGALSSMLADRNHHSFEKPQILILHNISSRQAL